MATATIPLALPHGLRHIELVYIDAYGHGVAGRTTGLVYLHRVRHFGADHPLVHAAASEYTLLLPMSTKTLAEYLAGRHFDAILAPPSSRRDLAPYLDAIVAALRPPEDWTELFARREGASAGSTASCQAMYESLALKSQESIAGAGAVLMVDDSFSSGTTACAILRRLIDAGLPEECQFTVAAPLWVRPKRIGPT
jgi:hypothetical protein